MMVLETKTSPKVSTSKRATVVFSFLGVGAVTCAFLFIFNLVDLPRKKPNGPNLLKNSSFEQWRHKKVIGWDIKKSKLLKEKKGAIDGKYMVGILNMGDDDEGISQTLKLDPLEIYNICYSLRSNRILSGSSGVEITYTGDEIKTTTDAEPGVHFHKGGKSWHQYFGRVTGASSITLKFFSRNKAITYVDAVGVGANLMPLELSNDIVQK